MLKEGLEKLRKERAIELYKDRKLTLSEAAKLADVGAGEMMDLLVKAGVQSEISIQDFEKSRKIRLDL
jgi:predicted HTH domain antitoxin